MTTEQVRQNRIAKSEAIQAMIDTEGFGILQTWINNQIGSKLTMLVDASIETVPGLQAEIKALKSVNLRIREYIADGRRAREENMMEV